MTYGETFRDYEENKDTFNKFTEDVESGKFTREQLKPVAKQLDEYLDKYKFDSDGYFRKIMPDGTPELRGWRAWHNIGRWEDAYREWSHLPKNAKRHVEEEPKRLTGKEGDISWNTDSTFTETQRILDYVKNTEYKEQEKKSAASYF